MKKKRIREISCFLVLMSFFLFPRAETFSAEPNPVIKYLMNEPVTMLDWGMYKLALYLNQEMRERYVNKISKFAPRITVFYNADADKIQISASMVYKKFPSPEEARTYCEGIIKYIRGALVFKQSKARAPVSPVAPRTTLGSYFGQQGGSPKNMPGDLEAELSKRTELIAVVMDKFDQPVICKASLLGSDSAFFYGPHEQERETNKRDALDEQGSE